MPKVVYTPGKGLVQSAGSGFEINSSTVNLGALPFSPVQALSTTAGGPNITIPGPGVYTLTAGSVATGSLPAAATYPGGMFIIRAADAFAYHLSGSGEANGVKAFKGIQSGSSVPQLEGSRITLSALAGASVAFVSDGKNYLILNSSGSLAFASP